MPVVIKNRQRTIRALALVDSGADLNVMPYRMGIALGGIWEEEREFLGIAGLSATADTRLMHVEVTVGRLPVARMGFTWTQSDAIDLVLGQVNFFSRFDVCFYRSRNIFEIALRKTK